MTGHPIYDFIAAVIALVAAVVSLLISLRVLRNLKNLTQEVRNNGAANVGTDSDVAGNPDRSLLPHERSE